MEPERIDKFKADIESMKLKTGRASRENALQAVGAVVMLVGVVLGVVGYNQSLDTAVSVRGQLDSTSDLTLAVVGVALTIAGTGIFIRYSLAKFLRIWMLRQSYENQANIERLVDRG
jgi:uncharacterized membrane protein YidH (DUF202 family)